MPGKIHILSESVMKRIAAGEVIQRPASAAKELMENALDAEAGLVTLLVKGAGSQLIQVSDDGCGMSEEDVLVCCQRHATSKIESAEDLDRIETLGFRGEALASISSVSRMVITTRTEEDGEATQVYLEDGEIREVLKTAANPGTSVSVKDLFAHVPARRKFLKSPNTEMRHIIGVFRQIALSHPECAFTLYIDEEKTIDLRPGDLKSRMADLLGDQLPGHLISVEKNFPGMKLRGYISAPGRGRKSRTNQFLFLNQRYISNRSIQHGILSAYGPRLREGEYPVYIIFLTMDAERFDVNVHPTKLEVRFADERFIHDAVYRAVKESLSTPEVVPDLGVVRSSRKAVRNASERRKFIEEEGQLTLEAQRPLLNKVFFPGEDQRDKIRPSLWQLHNRYILAQIKSGLVIIDQHVAHERILYERALKSREMNSGFSQQLLFPQTVELSPEHYLTLTEILPYLEKIGFGLKEFGKYTVVVEAVPVEIRSGQERDLLIEIIEYFQEIRKKSADILEAVAKAFACKSAIKSGERLHYHEMVALVDQLFATQEPYFCPHGRPVIVNLSLEELDKRFGR
jgi:DNA mismatch repair protein MutL